MKFLALDTTRKSANIIVCDDSRDLKKVIRIDENIKHSEGLFLYLEKALFDYKLQVEDFDYLSAIVGPGSFTGIRVGMSVIKAFNKVVRKQIIGLNTFELLKKHIKNGVLLLNSTTTACYFGVMKSGEIIEDGVIDKAQILSKFQGQKLFVLREELSQLALEIDNLNVIGNLNELYFDAIKNKINSGEDNVFEPYYLQLSQAERNKVNE